MDTLIFLTNKLQNPIIQRKMNLPLTFITFGIIEGKMYRHYNTKIIVSDINKKWGNEVCYGGVFLCKEFGFYSHILDAYHACSLSTLRKNHIKDLQHRITIPVYPIYFSSLDQLSRLKYREGEPIEVFTYMGNPKHPKIISRTQKTTSYRIIDGMDTNNFKQLYREVAHEL